MLSSTQIIKHAGTNKSSSKGLINLIFKASFCHKSELPNKNVRKWNYDKYHWGFSNFFLDPFTKRKFNENSKIIQVEGNVGAEKEDFAKRLANELGMYYMPKVDLTCYWINDHGFDYRALNPLLPERLRICDLEMFHENPCRHSVIHLQYHLFKLRFYQYVRALQHLFNTGQGVVMTRSIMTERVFVEAMHKLGWLPMGYKRDDGLRFYDFKNYHNYCRGLLIKDLLKPHLTIYLDRSVDKCLETIKKSPDPVVANSNALVPEFLNMMAESYEEIMLPKTELYGHLVRVPYEERATDDEILDVVEDISNLDFTYDVHDTKFEDWDENKLKFWYFFHRKHWTTRSFLTHARFLNLPNYDIAGFGDSITQIDLILREALYERHVAGIGYDTSFNTDLRFVNFFTALFDYQPFHKRILGEFRNDYV